VIFAIVVLFTCFPPAFSDIATGLNAPLSFALVGIVMRGAAFVFRNHTLVAFLIAARIGAVFLIPSLIFLFTVFKGPGATPLSSSH
jgi:cytochrome d ubiquinol oxidase subunit II